MRLTDRDVWLNANIRGQGQKTNFDFDSGADSTFGVSADTVDTFGVDDVFVPEGVRVHPVGTSASGAVATAGALSEPSKLLLAVLLVVEAKGSAPAATAPSPWLQQHKAKGILARLATRTSSIPSHTHCYHHMPILAIPTRSPIIVRKSLDWAAHRRDQQWALQSTARRTGLLLLAEWTWPQKDLPPWAGWTHW